MLFPSSTSPDRLHYTQDYDTFPPIMTRPGAYPTQSQANDAWNRSAAPSFSFPRILKGPAAVAESVAATRSHAIHIHLFACGPGQLDGIKGRMFPAGRNAVTCATDLLDSDGLIFNRIPLNFIYYNRAWHLIDPLPGYHAAPWRTYSPSPPHNPLPSWLPGVERY